MTHEGSRWTPKGEIIVSKIEAFTAPNGHGPLRLKDDCRQDILTDLRASGVDPNLLGRLKIEFLDRDKRPENVNISGNDDMDKIRIGINRIFGLEVLRSLDLSFKD